MGHKYMNEEGAPSRYWQDLRIQKLQEACGRVQLPERVRQEFIKAIGSRGEVADRFLPFLHGLTTAEITSAREVLERFADKDTRKAAWWKRWVAFCKWAPLLPVSTSLAMLFNWPYDWRHFALWGATATLLPLGLWAMLFAAEAGQPFTRNDVDEHFAENR